ncbi:hypothetical protein GPECTOR_4g790 [Gonium pectorale]|uniref:RRM domain-containing protein n=1 Tax=Gonium pectorale TaxID=33097 RepID=A0A150GYD6_GONPE|nr:hypothetical protein GPECTOR_4g790 [Gonium pectorale]|eukprot:KXZ54722.1 hypothetical protein GPECTOR_4g790 [Gonium pectorale]
MGFVLFSSAAAAAAAAQLVRDLEFDNGVLLRCEMAHKNMFLKDDPTVRRSDGRGALAQPGANGAVLAAMSQYSAATNGGMAFAAPQYGAAALPAYGPVLTSHLAATRPAAMPHHLSNGSGGGMGLLPPPGQASLMANQYAGLVNTNAAVGYGPITNRNDNPPCNTLFVGNLTDTVDEGELTNLFARQPGYMQLKLLRQERNPGYMQLKLLRQERNVSCFVEFADTPSAAAVHSQLQGAILASSGRGPIRIQYSKNPYGKRQQNGNANSYSAAVSAAANYAFMDAAAAAGGSGAVGVVPTASLATIMSAAGAPTGVAGDLAGWQPNFVVANGMPVAANGLQAAANGLQAAAKGLQ